MPPLPRAHPAKAAWGLRSTADALPHGRRIQTVQTARAQTVQDEAHPQGQAVARPEAGGAQGGHQPVRTGQGPAVPSPTIQ